MKAIVRAVVLLAFVLAVVMTPQAAAVAGETQQATFEFDLLDFGGEAEGDFTAYGAVEDSGAARQTYQFVSEELIVGTKYLYGEQGTIIIRFKAYLQPDGSAAGYFQLIKGTGAYRWLKGYGETYAWMTFEEDGLHLKGYYSGQVYSIDPK